MLDHELKPVRAVRIVGPRGGLRLDTLEAPQPGRGQVLVDVLACGVCRTDLHVADGEIAGCRYPIVPGHEIVGRVVALGDEATRWRVGDRVGVPWLGWTCGECEHCARGRENLCDRARLTGCHLDGGYAERLVADERYCVAIPARYRDVEAAPLLCAGLIGYRSYTAAGSASRLGLYGFGAAAHILAQVARADGREIYAFTRPGDTKAQAFALRLGAAWAGGSDETPPCALDAAIIFAPVGALVPRALAAVTPGGTVVCGGIHMSDIPSFAYSLLWGERTLRSVANLTRADAERFMQIAATTPIRTETTTFALDRAADALDALRSGRLEGVAVLVP